MQENVPFFFPGSSWTKRTSIDFTTLKLRRLNVFMLYSSMILFLKCFSHSLLKKSYLMSRQLAAKT